MVTAPGPRAFPSAEHILAGVTRIAEHRQVVLRLNSLLDDESRGVEELVSVIKLDAGLCMRVVSAANTVFFRGGLPVASVDEAIIRVGVWEVRRLLLGSIACELMGSGLKFYGVAPGVLWHRSLSCALAMDALGQEARRSTDVCYTIGLLHGVGLVAVERWTARPANAGLRPIGFSGGPDLGERERRVIGHTSSALGGRLLEQWKFPESICAAITHQETPLRAGRFRRLACLLVVGRWVSETILASEANDPLPALPDEIVQAECGVSIDDSYRLIDPVRARFSEYKAAVGGE